MALRASEGSGWQGILWLALLCAVLRVSSAEAVEPGAAACPPQAPNGWRVLSGLADGGQHSNNKVECIGSQCQLHCAYGGGAVMAPGAWVTWARTRPPTPDGKVSGTCEGRRGTSKTHQVWVGYGPGSGPESDMWKSLAETLLRMAESWALPCPRQPQRDWPETPPRQGLVLCMEQWLAAGMPYAAVVAQCSAMYPDQFGSNLPPRVEGFWLFSKSVAPNGYFELHELPDRVYGRIVLPDNRSLQVGGVLRNIQQGWVFDLQWWDGVNSGSAQLFVRGNVLSGEWVRSDGAREAWSFER